LQGYALSTGLPDIDHMVLDAVVAPPLAEGVDYEFSENRLTLPLYHLNNQAWVFGNHTAPRPLKGVSDILPPAAFHFCAVTDIQKKVSPETLDIWLNVLVAVPNLVFLVFDNPLPAARAAIGRLLVERGLSERFLFVPRTQPFLEHLTHKAALCDLVMDTREWNGHSSLADTIYAGIPFLALPGQNMLGRVSAAFASHLGVHADLLASSWADYTSRAVQLASNHSHYHAVRARFVEGVKGTGFFDVKRMVRQREAAFVAMWTQYLAGRSPVPDLRVDFEGVLT
jgi:predicted O-linked N-acetylglucosamine transferase (SPINDLY family)